MNDLTITNNFAFLSYKTNWFYVTVLFSVTDHRKRQNAIRTSVVHPAAPRVGNFFVLTTFCRLQLWSVTEQKHGNMESICNLHNGLLSSYIHFIISFLFSLCWNRLTPKRNTSLITCNTSFRVEFYMSSPIKVNILTSKSSSDHYSLQECTYRPQSRSHSTRTLFQYKPSDSELVQQAVNNSDKYVSLELELFSFFYVLINFYK